MFDFETFNIQCGDTVKFSRPDSDHISIGEVTEIDGEGLVTVEVWKGLEFVVLSSEVLGRVRGGG